MDNLRVTSKVKAVAILVIETETRAITEKAEEAGTTEAVPMVEGVRVNQDNHLQRIGSTITSQNTVRTSNPPPKSLRKRAGVC
jgi:hypothetical protein